MSEFVYFIKPCGLYGPIKIGCSQAPTVRLESYMRWSPLPLELIVAIPGTPGLEANIHSCLSRSHSHLEWFHPTDEVCGLIAKLVAGIPIEKAIDLSDRHGQIGPNNKRIWSDRRKAMAGIVPYRSSSKAPNPGQHQ